jgi:DNA-binding CsgD family transcriptional regulator/pimeloyl-ACP methyl ester carboxylesterase
MEPPPVQYVTTSDGVNVAYGVCGSGVLLIHLPVVWNHFSLQWTSGIRRSAFEGLAQRHKLVLYDGRGQGSSDRGLPAALSLAQVDLDLEAVVGKFERQPIVLLGPSAFGLIAIRYAVHHPESVAGLVLWNYADRPAFASPLLDMATTDWEYYLDTTARNGFPVSESTLVKQVLRETMTQPDLLLLARLLRSESVDGLLEGVKAPTMILASRAGAVAGPNEESGRRLAAKIPGARLRLLDGPSGGWEPDSGGRPPSVTAIEQFTEALIGDLPVERSPEGKAGLSTREVEVLRLVAEGRSNAQIGDALVISPNTVGRHVSNIFDKIGAANRAEATAYALRNGLA